MNDYILILTLVTLVGKSPATTMTSVPGFKDKASCVNAADAWIRNIHDYLPTNILWYSSSEICVPAQQGNTK